MIDFPLFVDENRIMCNVEIHEIVYFDLCFTIGNKRHLGFGQQIKEDEANQPSLFL